jgi:hypothetical protein
MISLVGGDQPGGHPGGHHVGSAWQPLDHPGCLPGRKFVGQPFGQLDGQPCGQPGGQSGIQPGGQLVVILVVSMYGQLDSQHGGPPGSQPDDLPEVSLMSRLVVKLYCIDGHSAFSLRQVLYDVWSGCRRSRMAVQRFNLRYTSIEGEETQQRSPGVAT